MNWKNRENNNPLLEWHQNFGVCFLFDPCWRYTINEPHSADNMFIEYRCSVKDHLKLGKNSLVIIFPSTFLKGRDFQNQHGKFACWNGDPSRLHVRKAQYQ